MRHFFHVQTVHSNYLLNMVVPIVCYYVITLVYILDGLHILM
jgi:hypothetical protein